jgi:hypothetical protein
MTAERSKDISINATVDFERAKERLESVAGRAFRTWQTLKKGGTASAAEIEAAATAYRDADDAAKALRRTDEQAIRRVLEMPL